jgi:RNA polymerase sigma-70 factor (ECF subfamily)
LIQQAVNGDGVALKLLLTDSHRCLCDRIARWIPTDLRRVVDAEDIAQDAHVEVFRRIRDFQPRRPHSFERWLTAIALSRLRNAIKKHRSLQRGGGCVQVGAAARAYEDSAIALLDTLAGPGHTPSRSVARLEAAEAVQTALTGLPDHYEQAVWLVHIEGRSVRETAAQMGRTERAVHGLCRRGLKKLREHLLSETRFLS